MNVKEFQQQLLTLATGNPPTVVAAIKYFRQCFTESSALKFSKRLSGRILLKLVDILEKSNHVILQIESARAISAAINVRLENATILMTLNLGPTLLRIATNTKNVRLRNQCMLCICNLAVYGPRCREHLLKIGALKYCVDAIKNVPDLTYRRVLLWTLVNLCCKCEASNQPCGPFKSAANVFCDIISETSSASKKEVNSHLHIIIEACTGLSYIIKGRSIVTGWCVDEKQLFSRLLDLISCFGTLKENDQKIISVSLDVVEHLFNCDTRKVQKELENHDFTPVLRDILHHANSAVAEKVCKFLTGIVSRRPRYLDKIIGCPALVAGLNLYASSHKIYSVRRQAALVLCAILKMANERQRLMLIEQHCIAALCYSLHPTADTALLKAALIAFEIMLEMDNLQSMVQTVCATYSVPERLRQLATPTSNDTSDMAVIKIKCNEIWLKYF